MQIPYTVEARPDSGLTNGKFGIWLFLASEVMLVGALFSTYIILRTGALEWPHGELNIWLGMANTFIAGTKLPSSATLVRLISIAPTRVCSMVSFSSPS